MLDERVTGVSQIYIYIITRMVGMTVSIGYREKFLRPREYLVLEGV